MGTVHQLLAGTCNLVWLFYHRFSNPLVSGKCTISGLPWDLQSELQNAQRSSEFQLLIEGKPRDCIAFAEF